MGDFQRGREITWGSLEMAIYSGGGELLGDHCRWAIYSGGGKLLGDHWRWRFTAGEGNYLEIIGDGDLQRERGNRRQTQFGNNLLKIG